MVTYTYTLRICEEEARESDGDSEISLGYLARSRVASATIVCQNKITTNGYKRPSIVCTLCG